MAQDLVREEHPLAEERFTDVAPRYVLCLLYTLSCQCCRKKKVDEDGEGSESDEGEGQTVEPLLDPDATEDS